MVKRMTASLLFALASSTASAADSPPPIIDMHLHANRADENGPPPTAVCPGIAEWAVLDPKQGWPAVFGAMLKKPPCSNPVWGPASDEELMRETLAILERRNITAVTSGSELERWKKAGGKRIIPALEFEFSDKPLPTPADVRKWFTEKRYAVFAEVAIQYDGVSPSDPKFEPYLAVAESLDVPLGIHIGTGPPGAPYLGFSEYRARLHSPLLLEDALVRHPKLRVYIMHAGWPMLDDLLAVLWAHPQVHLDVGAIAFALPRKEFHRYLQRIVEAGFGSRVLFGSDQMNWPKTIDVAIEAIETAPFLTKKQKRAILYDNAARFLRLPASGAPGTAPAVR